MTEKEIFLQRMDAELPITLKVFRAIPADKTDFTPHERSQTAKQVVQTMIAEVSGAMRILRGDEQTFIPVEVPTFEEAVSMYEKEFAACREFIQHVSEEDMDKPVEGAFAKFFPRRMDGAWMFFCDSIHHRGQLSVYIRLAGGKVPSIYGPSADDNPF